MDYNFWLTHTLIHMSIIQCQFYESESARAESDYDSLTVGSKYVSNFITTEGSEEKMLMSCLTSWLIGHVF